MPPWRRWARPRRGGEVFGESDTFEQKWVWGGNITRVSKQWDYFPLPTILHENTLITSVITVHFQTSNLKPCHDSWTQESHGVPIGRERVQADIAHQVGPVSASGPSLPLQSSALVAAVGMGSLLHFPQDRDWAAAWGTAHKTKWHPLNI